MHNSLQVGGDPAQLTPQQIIEELISERVNRWMTKQITVPNRELAAELVAMCWDYDFIPETGPGCLLPDHMGGYTYIPYDEGRDGLPDELRHRADTLDHWAKDPANAPALRKIDKLLEKEVNATCFWDFLDGGNASRIDFNGKVKMLAKNRLTQNGLVGVDVSPDNPRNPDFRFAATDINEFGNVRMKWHTFSWNCPEGDIVLALEAYSRPSYTPASVLDTQLKYLEAIHHPGNAAKEAEDLAAKLKASQAPKNEPQWLYFLCAQDEADVPLEQRDWAQMRKQPNDIKMMKRMSREQGKWPVIIRPSQLRHYKNCRQIHKLQECQLEYCQAADEAARLEREQQQTSTGKPHCDDKDIGVPVSVLDFAWEHGPRLLGGVDTERGRAEVDAAGASDGLGELASGADLEALWLDDMRRRSGCVEATGGEGEA